MECAKLGLTDLSISRIGFGCWAIGGHGYGKVDDRESREAIRKALEIGINFFDTADVYGFGHSEKILGSALGSQRHEAVIATKFGVAWDENGKTYKDCSPNRITEALDASLKRLGIDCIPLYQIHWHDGVTPFADIMETLRRCQEKGKIRYIGCSNLSTALILEADKSLRLESSQMPYNLIHRGAERDIYHCFNKLKMGILTYGVLARGLLSGKYSVESKFSADDTRSNDPNFSVEAISKSLTIVQELEKIGRAYHKTPSQVAVRWVLDNPSITTAIVGMKTAQQVIENAESAEWRLNVDDWERLSNLHP
jgi:aryl-alcohol dehydrogenase-like predicted oxidoreductase